MRSLPEWISGRSTMNREETPSIKHTQDQSLPCNADRFDKRPQWVFHKFKGRDQEDEIHSVVPERKELGIPVQARRASEAMGFQQHGPGGVDPYRVEPTLGQPASKMACPAADLQHPPHRGKPPQELPEEPFLQRISIESRSRVPVLVARRHRRFGKWIDNLRGHGTQSSRPTRPELSRRIFLKVCHQCVDEPYAATGKGSVRRVTTGSGYPEGCRERSSREAAAGSTARRGTSATLVKADETVRRQCLAKTPLATCVSSLLGHRQKRRKRSDITQHVAHLLLG